MSLRLAWLVLCAVLAACSGAVSVPAIVMTPARVPVATYPTVVISTGRMPAEVTIANQLAAALRGAGVREVRRVDPGALEAERTSGKLSGPTLVVMINVEVHEDVRGGFSTVPVRVCGVYGTYGVFTCSTYYDDVYVQITEVLGTAHITVHEGESARVLQRESVRVALRRGDMLDMREQIGDALAERVIDLVSEREREESVELLKVRTDAVRNAIGHAKDGRWDYARAELERFVGGGSLDELSTRDKSRVYYDLALTRVFAPGASAEMEASYTAAEQALQKAMELDNFPELHQAAYLIERRRTDLARLREQRAAREHNFGLAAPK